ncbi:hypothetical protein ACJMK2_042849, partial [Sinanodonta woodiana]
LYVGTVPARHKFRHLRIGCNITVHNIHHKCTRKTPKIRLYSCMRSCVKVTEFSPLVHSGQVINSPPYLQDLFFLSGASSSLLDWLKDTRDSLSEKFQAEAGSSGSERMSECLLHMNFPYQYGAGRNQQKAARNLLQEFLSDEHHCCILSSYQSEKECLETTFPTLKEIFTPYLPLMDNTGPSGSDLYWKYTIAEELNTRKQVLPDMPTNQGHICSNNCSCDDLELGKSLHCHDNQGHICSNNCSCDDLELGKSFPCPLIHTCCIGKTVVVTKYNIIKEDFVSSQRSANDSHTPETETLIYVEFSMKDAVLLWRLDSLQDSHVCDRTEIGRKRKHEDEHTTDMSVIRQSSDMGGHMAQSGTSVEEQSEMVVHIKCKESLVLESWGPNPDKLRFCTVSQVIRTSNVKDMPKEVILLFRGGSVRWYPVLIVGCMYRLSGQNFVSTVPPSLPVKLIKTAVQRSQAKVCIVVETCVMIERLFTAIAKIPVSVDDIKKISIQEILSSECRENLVSFECIITARFHCDPELPNQRSGKAQDWKSRTLPELGVNLLPNKCVKLVVKDVVSSQEMQVYINLDRVSYPLGLLPGVHLLFHRVERRVSRNGHVYCHYITISTIEVLCMSSKGHGHQAEADVVQEQIQVLSEDSAPKLPLVAIWKPPFLDTSSILQCVCHVQKILKLSLKSVCITCGSLYKRSGCSNRGCTLQSLPKLLARCSFIGEDGTSVALISCTGCRVQQLLQLSEEEWNTLENTLVDLGEVFVQQASVLIT